MNEITQIGFGKDDEIQEAKNTLNAIVSSDELYLHYNNEIVKIFKKYPSLKEISMNDNLFLNKLFNEFKGYFSHTPLSIYYNHNDIKQFEGEQTIIDMALKDEDFQNEFNTNIKLNIANLKTSVEYNESDYTEYTEDRLRGLLYLEKAYLAPYIKEDIKRKNKPQLLDTLKIWSDKKLCKGEWYKRVYNLVKNSGVVTEEEYGSVLYSSWKDNKSNPVFLSYPEFPQDKISDKEHQDKIRGDLIENIESKDIDFIISYISQYKFIEEKINNPLEAAEDIAIFEKAISNKLLNLISTKRYFLENIFSAKKLNDKFSIIDKIPRDKLVNAIYKGLNAEAWNTTQDIISDKKELLEQFPLSHEEAEKFIIDNIDGVPHILEYFSGIYDFDEIYTKPEIENKLLQSRGNTYGTKYFNNHNGFYNFLKDKIDGIKVSDLVIDKHIEGINRLATDKNENYIKNNYRFDHIIAFGEYGDNQKYIDKESAKLKIETEETKEIYKKYIISVFKRGGYGFYGHSDEQRQDIYNNELFPFSEDEINHIFYEYFLSSCANGDIIFDRNKNKYIDEKIKENGQEFQKAITKGVFKLLDIELNIDDVHIKMATLNRYMEKLSISINDIEDESITMLLLKLKEFILENKTKNLVDHFNDLISNN